MNTAKAVAEQLYRALSDGDADALSAALSADFHATVSAGMPHDVGGEHHGRVAMIAGVWGRIDAIYDLAVVPSEFLEIGGGNKVVVLGTYRPVVDSRRRNRAPPRSALRPRRTLEPAPRPSW